MLEQALNVQRENELIARYNLTRLCARVLACKDVRDEDIAALLAPPHLQDPFSANGMKEIVERIIKAKNFNERVLICGDYDADGICATAIFVDALRQFGIQTGFYIPDRLKEGYGLQTKTVEMAKKRGYTLLITVDNGVRAFEALKCAHALGIDVIITDHHVLDEKEDLLCYALLHPAYMGGAFASLSGAGIALEVSRALGVANDRQIVYAGIAAVGDVMKMEGESRNIVRLCIDLLNRNKVQSIQLLANDSNTWDETKIAFQIVPKLNVTGRLSDRCNVNNTVRYLLSDDAKDLIAVSKQIQTLNDMRKAMSTQMEELAFKKISPNSEFVIVSDASFHEGIVGLVAGKLCEKLERPCMILAQKGDLLRGSIRSIEGIDLSHFFDELPCEKQFGGHALAAGITFEKKDLSKVKLYVQQQLAKQPPFEKQPKMYIPVEKDLLTIKEVESLKQLKPFGNGFDEPVFCVKDLTITSVRTLGNQQHMKWVEKNGMELLLFNAGDKIHELKEGGYHFFAGTLNINRFRNQQRVNMIIQAVER